MAYVDLTIMVNSYLKREFIDSFVDVADEVKVQLSGGSIYLYGNTASVVTFDDLEKRLFKEEEIRLEYNPYNISINEKFNKNENHLDYKKKYHEKVIEKKEAPAFVNSLMARFNKVNKI